MTVLSWHQVSHKWSCHLWSDNGYECYGSCDGSHAIKRSHASKKSYTNRNMDLDYTYTYHSSNPLQNVSNGTDRANEKGGGYGFYHHNQAT